MDKLSMIPAIDLIIAPMYAGKTTELLRRLSIYYEMDLKVCYVNSSQDTRTASAFSTHNKILGQLPFDNRKVTQLHEFDATDYNVIGVDEGQLFSDLFHTVIDWVENKGKIVIIAGLNGDYRRQNFGQINDLIPVCDTITKLSSFCVNCKENKGKITPAIFTKRTIADNNVVLIGGKDMYIPVCRKCFIKI